MEEEKYNLITQELLLAGYCAEHHPDYVVVPAGRCGASPLDNTDGGFVYNRKYLEKAVFVTGCGLSVRYRECIGRLDYMDRMFCAENDNVIVKCPKYKKVCAYNDPLLSSESNYLCFCVCHMASDYTYEKSIQYLTEKADQLKEERLICPLSSRQVKYLKVSDKNTYISFWSVGIFMHTISLYIF